MKRYLVLTGLTLTLCALACAQDLGGERVVVPARNSARPRVVKAELHNGSITVKTHAGNDVIVETATHGRNRGPERTPDGLRRLNLPNRGLEVDESDNTITIRLSHEEESGSVVVTVPPATSLQLRSHNGEINVDGVQGEADLTSYNGQIVATNMSGAVVADTRNGQIKVTFNRVDPGKPIAFTSYNGPIDVTLPADFKANLKLRTSQGDVYTDFDVKLVPVAGDTITTPTGSGDMRRLRTNQVINGTINGGGSDASFTTYNGKILIRKR
jgi:Putative adhesin